MEKRMIKTCKRGRYIVILSFVTICCLTVAMTGCSDTGLEEIIDNPIGRNQGTGLSIQSHQNEWTLQSVYFLGKVDTGIIDVRVKKTVVGDDWTFNSKVNDSQKLQMSETADRLTTADIDCCTDSTFMVNYLGEYLKIGRCKQLQTDVSPYTVIGVWKYKGSVAKTVCKES